VWPDSLGVLLTPDSGNTVEYAGNLGLPFACDNGCFVGFKEEKFYRLCRKVDNHPKLLWITCPDKVADAEETLHLFRSHAAEVSLYGPVAFVAQDGQEDLELPEDYPLGHSGHPWRCLFIGGTTKFKLSQAAGDLAEEAKNRGKLVHMGRVNSMRRLQTALDMGCDTVDGTATSMFGDTYVNKFCKWVKHLKQQGVLYGSGTHA
jgi:hypothetical protein